jgi:DNA-binding transcriptional ArsR family regulator
MVNCLDNELDATFAALSDPTRREILTLLARGQSHVTQLAARFDMSLPAVSKHLRVLETAGLVSRERDGRVHRMHLRAKPMQGASQWIDQYRQFWEGQLDALANFLEQPDTTNKENN